MRDSVQFISFEETPKEQKVRGFATIKKTYPLNFKGVETQVIEYERYKLTNSDKGGYYVQACSIKRDSDPNEHIFISSNEYDSKFVKDTIEDIIRVGYKLHCAEKEAPKIQPIVDTKIQTANVEDVELPF